MFHTVVEMANYAFYVFSGQEMRDHPDEFMSGLRRGLLMGSAIIMPPMVALLLVATFYPF